MTTAGLDDPADEGRVRRDTAALTDARHSHAEHRGSPRPAQAGVPRRHHLQDPVPGVRGPGHTAAHRVAATGSSAPSDVERLRYVLARAARPLPAAEGDQGPAGRHRPRAGAGHPGAAPAALAGARRRARRRRTSPPPRGGADDPRRAARRVRADRHLARRAGTVRAGRGRSGRLLRRRRGAGGRHAPPSCWPSASSRVTCRSFRTAADREADAGHPAGLGAGPAAGPGRPGARRRRRPRSWPPTILRLHTQLVKAGLRRDLGR